MIKAACLTAIATLASATQPLGVFMQKIDDCRGEEECFTSFDEQCRGRNSEQDDYNTWTSCTETRQVFATICDGAAEPAPKRASRCAC